MTNRKKNGLRAVIFDLDGTLVDTEPAACAAIEAVFRRFGAPITSEDARFITGRKWSVAFEFLFKKYQLEALAEKIRVPVIEEYHRLLREDLPLIPGSVEAVRSMYECFPLALVSGSSRAEIAFALQAMGVESCFKVILGAEDYPRSKPDPQCYLQAIQALGVRADEALVFEDSTAGIQAGREAGLWVVAIEAANHFAQDQSRAHHRIKNFSQIDAEWVSRLGLPPQSS